MSNAEHNIRPAHSDEVDALQAIAAQSAEAALWTAQQYAQLFARESPKRICLVVEDGGAIAGFIVGLIVAEEWEIENLAVRLDAQRRGLGAKLVAALVAEAKRRHASRIHLEVRESNTPARKLYEQAGFEPSGRRTGYYASPTEDAILLTLPIS